MYHSVTVGEKNTFLDFGLIPTSRPVISPPSPNFSYLEIPGCSGAFDISEAVSGTMTYANRTGSLEFYVKGGRDWTQVYSEILSAIHGKQMTVTLEDEPSYFYVGRISVNQWKSEKNYSSIVLDYDLFPYKYAWTSENEVPWMDSTAADSEGWTKMDVTVAGSTAISLEPMGDMPVVPVFWVKTVSGTLEVTVAGETYTLAKGKNRIPECRVKENAVPVVFEGNATLSIYMRRGWL